MNTSVELPKLRYIPFKIVSSSKVPKLNSMGNRKELTYNNSKGSEENSYANNILNKRKKYIKFIQGLTSQDNNQFESSRDYLNISSPQILDSNERVKLQGRKAKIINYEESPKYSPSQSISILPSSPDIEPIPTLDFNSQNDSEEFSKDNEYYEEKESDTEILNEMKSHPKLNDTQVNIEKQEYEAEKEANETNEAKSRITSNIENKIKKKRKIGEIKKIRKMEEYSTPYLESLYKGKDFKFYILMKPYNFQIYLQASRFRGRPKTVVFNYPPICEEERPNLNIEIFTQENIGQNYLSFSISETTTFNDCVLKALKYNGFRYEHNSNWNIMWSGLQKTFISQNLLYFQKTNHFPGTYQVARKDNLWRNINRLRFIHGNEYNIAPMTYVLPEDLNSFLTEQEVIFSRKIGKLEDYG